MSVNTEVNARLDTHQPSHQSQLFILRVWLEDLGEGKTEWRGQVKHVMSGEVRYFREWATLVKHLKAMLSSVEKNGTAMPPE
jgi:hypothetical protein